jgi:hypothetical protein
MQMAKSVEISNWCDPSSRDAVLRVYAVDHMSDGKDSLAGRICLTAHCGAMSMQIHPTVAETRDLIAALQWSLEAAEPVVAEAA